MYDSSNCWNISLWDKLSTNIIMCNEILRIFRPCKKIDTFLKNRCKVHLFKEQTSNNSIVQLYGP